MSNEGFWNKVDKTSNPNGCWEWTGSCKDGYGRVRINYKLRYAHRVSAYWAGILPTLDGNKRGSAGKVLRHSCHNRRCVNPEHLTIGTQTENVQDTINDSRQARGSRMGTAKLTESKVARIRELYRTGRFSILDLAKTYGCHHTTISAVILRKTWRHV